MMTDPIGGIIHIGTSTSSATMPSSVAFLASRPFFTIRNFAAPSFSVFIWMSWLKTSVAMNASEDARPLELGPVEVLRRHLAEQPAEAADLRVRQRGVDHDAGDREEHQRLHELPALIAHAPPTTHMTVTTAPTMTTRLTTSMPKRACREHGERVQPEPGVENAQRDLDPREYLLVHRAESLADRLGRRHDAHLAEPCGQEAVGERHRDEVAGEQDEEEQPVLVHARRAAGERPGAERAHDDGGPRDPPHHRAARAEVVAGVLVEPVEDGPSASRNTR